MEAKELKIKKGDVLRIRVYNRTLIGGKDLFIEVECMNAKGRKKHYFDDQNGKDYRFSDDYIKRNIVDENNDFLFSEFKYR